MEQIFGRYREHPERIRRRTNVAREDCEETEASEGATGPQGAFHEQTRASRAAQGLLFTVLGTAESAAPAAFWITTLSRTNA